MVARVCEKRPEEQLLNGHRFPGATKMRNQIELMVAT